MHAMSFSSASAGAKPMKSLIPANRITYLDTLRIVLTILVIVHHVGQAYGPTGGYWPVQETARAAILGSFFTVNRSFFMSLFFMISGYFMVSGYQRNGFAGFLRNRLVRLGVPVLVFAALMLPARIFLFGEHITRWGDYFNSGHFWYLENVLLFSVVYALWRKVRESPRKNAARPDQEAQRPAPRLLVTFAALPFVAVMCGIVRIWSPIDRWTNLLGFFRVAFADLPRDLAFFIFGAMAFRRGWFESFPTRRGMTWLAVGVAAPLAWYAWSLIPARRPQRTGLRDFLPDLGRAACFGMCIGLLVMFRQAAGAPGPFGRMLVANQYSRDRCGSRLPC
jgi:hypothetical protein